MTFTRRPALPAALRVTATEALVGNATLARQHHRSQRGKAALVTCAELEVAFDVSLC
jgi:hypothetical protein